MSNKTKPNHIFNKVTPLTSVQLKIRELKKRIQRLKDGMDAVRKGTSLELS